MSSSASPSITNTSAPLSDAPSLSGAPSNVSGGLNNANSDDLGAIVASVSDELEGGNSPNNFNNTTSQTTTTNNVSVSAASTSIQSTSHQPEVITNDSTFDNYHILVSKVERLWDESGMKRSSLCRTTAVVFNKEEAIDAFGTPTYGPAGKEYNIPRRGTFYCNVDKCNHCVPFSWFKKNSHYKIGKQGLCLTHNHPTCGIVLDGVVHVNNEGDLTPEEIQSIHLLAIANSDMAKVKETLSIEYPSRHFTSSLLHRVMGKKRDAVFGIDRHQMTEVMKYGTKAAVNGGVWVPLICEDTLRFSGCHYQSYRMRKYATMYGNYFVTADGTHLTNGYRLVNVPWVVKDCLGKSKVAGFGLFKHENSYDIAEAGRLLGISCRQVTVDEVDNDDASLSNDSEENEVSQVEVSV